MAYRIFYNKYLRLKGFSFELIKIILLTNEQTNERATDW